MISISRISPRFSAPRSIQALLAGLLVAAFFTGSRFIDGIRNNFGLFEVLGLGLLVSYGGLVVRQKSRPRLHPVIVAAIVIDGIAALSLAWLPPESVSYGIIQVLILWFLTCILIVLYNLLTARAVNLITALRFIALVALILGTWIIMRGGESEVLRVDAGFFRNRSHMGLHFLTIFWMTLLLGAWPRRPLLDRVLVLSALLVLLYGIAGSGRRSVYLSLFVGLVVLVAGVVVAGGANRRSLALAAVATIAFLAWYYVVAPEFSLRARFFRDRVGLIGARLDLATASRDETSPGEYNFLLLQREGALRAFYAHPILGIGWAGFRQSTYNPTGHEMHPTPLRFLAEAGIVGFTAYLAFVGLIFGTSLKTYLRARGTPLATPTLVMCVAVAGLAFSWAYNRHIHERTFWIFVAVLLALENYVDHARESQRRPVTTTAVGQVAGSGSSSWSNVAGLQDHTSLRPELARELSARWVDPRTRPAVLKAQPPPAKCRCRPSRAGGAKRESVQRGQWA